MNHIRLVLVLTLATIYGCHKKEDSVEIIRKISVNQSQGGLNTSSVLFDQWNFEDASPLHLLGLETTNTTDISVVTDPIDPSNKVMKCIMPTSSYRTEVSMINSNGNLLYFYANSTPGTPSSLSLGSEVWLGGRVFKPNESGLLAKASIVQLGPVNNPVTYPGMGSGGFTQLRINPNTNMWNWRVFSSPYTPIVADKDLKAIDYGKWETFVLHCRYRNDGQGILEVWNDGVKTVSTIGANAILNNRIRVKWGIYTGAGNLPTSPISCYFDDIKVGGSSSSYQEVVPMDTILVAAADTYVYGASPSTNYGSSTVLNVKNGGNDQYNRIAYLKFDLNSINFTPSSAKLLLTTETSTQAGELTVNQCSPSNVNWTENLYSWSNRPATGNSIDSVEVINSTNTQQLVFDLSSYVISKYTGGQKIITVALTGNNALLVLKSSNSSASGKPRLSLIK